jgi:hypothetical protein
MKGEIDLAAFVLLIVGGVAIYLAYRDPRMGAAILVGAGVVVLLRTLLRKNRGE